MKDMHDFMAGVALGMALAAVGIAVVVAAVSMGNRVPPTEPCGYLSVWSSPARVVRVAQLPEEPAWSEEERAFHAKAQGWCDALCNPFPGTKHCPPLLASEIKNDSFHLCHCNCFLPTPTPQTGAE